jgi:hypothetical protein
MNLAERWVVALAILTALALAAPVAAELEAAGIPARSPVIATGWDSPNLRQFREGLAAFEAWGVFDGTTLRASRRTPDNPEAAAIFAFSKEPWAWEEFTGALADLQAARPTTCRESYLMLYSNPGDVDWFDDESWRIITDHWRLLSRLAKQGGLRGLLFDAEPYTPPYSQFLYRAQPQRDQHSFAEYREKARQRGREVMTAAAEEFPELSIFSYRLFSDMLGVLDSGDLNRAVEPHTYGLLPAFVDGWLDVMPPKVRVIEGTEDIGYRANSSAEYSAAFTRLKLRLPEFVAPGNREKARQQFRVGQSLYLDAHVNPPGNPWTIDRLGGTSAGRLAANVASALAASDGVVWLYGETGRWWQAGDPKYPMWPERLPGALEAIRRPRTPQASPGSCCIATRLPRTCCRMPTSRRLRRPTGRRKGGGSGKTMRPTARSPAPGGRWSCVACWTASWVASCRSSRGTAMRSRCG